MQGSQGGKAVGGSTAYGNAAVGKTSSGDMYAGKDGNVYKNTGSGWQKYDNSSGSWNTVNKPQNQQQAQQQGQRQKQTYQNPSSQANAQQAQQQKQTNQQQRPPKCTNEFVQWPATLAECKPEHYVYPEPQFGNAEPAERICAGQQLPALDWKHRQRHPKHEWWCSAPLSPSEIKGPEILWTTLVNSR